MKTKEKKALRELSVDELKQKLEKTRHEYFDDKFKREEKNVCAKRNLRRNIARLLTIIREKSK